MSHEQNCTFVDFYIILTNHNPYGPDQSLSISETGINYDSNVTLDTDTKNDVNITFNYCPSCGCKLND